MRMLPETHVVKAYNIVGNTHMVDPDLPGGPPTMFIGGDSDEAKRGGCFGTPRGPRLCTAVHPRRRRQREAVRRRAHSGSSTNLA